MFKDFSRNGWLQELDWLNKDRGKREVTVLSNKLDKYSVSCLIDSLDFVGFID